MHCRLPQTTLSRELDFLRTGIPVEHVAPAALRLSVVGDLLELAVGTSALALSSLTRIEEPSRGSIGVRASLFRQLVSQLPSEPITLSVSSNRLSVEWPHGHASLPGLMLPVFNNDLGGETSMLDMPAKALGDLLAKSKPSWAQQHISIPGALVSLGKGTLRVVGLDGPSMAVVDSLVESSSSGEVILPAAGLQAMSTMLSDIKSGLATLAIGGKCIRLAANGRSVTVRAASGKFPDYLRIIPPTHDTPVVLHRIDLVEAIRRVVLTGEDEFSQVSFNCSRDMVTLESEASREEFSASYAGPDTIIRFDATRLNKILVAMGSDRVELYIGGDRLPAMLKPYGDDLATFILVPIRKP